MKTIMVTKTSRRSLFLASLAAFSFRRTMAQQPPQPYVPKQSDRPEPLEGDEDGFVPIFDGKTLAGWEGDPKYWRAADGIMTGEVTPETLLRSNTFLIWRGGGAGVVAGGAPGVAAGGATGIAAGGPAGIAGGATGAAAGGATGVAPGGATLSAPGGVIEDFELKVDYRITAGGNSGVNYRSVVVPDAVTPANRFAMRGYQCDIDGQNRYTGNNYEEKGRLFLAQRGDVTHVTGTRKPIVLSRTGDNQELARSLTEGWNAVHLVVRGNVMIHNINGRLMSVTIDDDPKRERTGLIGVQVHVGPPMRIEYRNWRIRKW